jgi:hypothetical protein
MPYFRKSLAQLIESLLRPGRLIKEATEGATSARLLVSPDHTQALRLANDGTLVVHCPGTHDGVVVSPVGRQMVWVPAGAMTPRATSGAEIGSSETSTHKVNLRTLDFDAAAQEHAQFLIGMPPQWDAGTVTAEFVWTAASGSGAVVWGLQAVAVGNNDALDAAFGTAQTATDTLLTASAAHLSPETGAITIAGAPAAKDTVVFQVHRAAAAGGDTLAVDAQLIGVRLYLTTQSAIDS